MGLREIERALDRLENVLCAAKVTASVKQEVDSFCTFMASQLIDAMQAPETERRELFERFKRPEPN